MLTVRSYCWICQLPVWSHRAGICYWCQQQLLSAALSCLRCGLPRTARESPCEYCARHSPLWDRLVYVSDYQPPLSKLLHQLKFSQKTAHVAMLSRLILLSYLSQRRLENLPKPDCLLCVPLHKRRKHQRGFNQSELLARPLSHWLACSYLPDALTRIRATAAKHRLKADMRRENLKGAFRLETNLSGRHIALLDDFVTTGQTVGEISCLLRQQNVASIQVWCLCRTL